MKYQVVWEENARSEIASEFVNNNDKAAIIDAAREIDLALGSDPIRNGQPLNEGMFFVDRPPLRAIYSVDHDGKRVEIGRIRRVSQSG